jgi:hypothetical protein
MMVLVRPNTITKSHLLPPSQLSAYHLDSPTSFFHITPQWTHLFCPMLRLKVFTIKQYSAVEISEFLALGRYRSSPQLYHLLTSVTKAITFFWKWSSGSLLCQTFARLRGNHIHGLEWRLWLTVAILLHFRTKVMPGTERAKDTLCLSLPLTPTWLYSVL